MEIDKESTKEEILEKFEQLKEAFKTLKGKINEPKYYYQQDSLSAHCQAQPKVQSKASAFG